jgi:glutamate synthase domain-containing protein 2
MSTRRYVLEMLRPEIRQYFIEGDKEMLPFSREQRSIVYSRAKGQVDTMPLGTRRDVYLEGYEWTLHSMFPTHVTEADARTLIGGPECKQPYSASLLNVSAMSYGALSDNAILALNSGAKMGGFCHNTGEGGMSKFHLLPGGDICFQVVRCTGRSRSLLYRSCSRMCGCPCSPLPRPYVETKVL